MDHELGKPLLEDCLILRAETRITEHFWDADRRNLSGRRAHPCVEERMLRLPRVNQDVAVQQAHHTLFATGQSDVLTHLALPGHGILDVLERVPCSDALHD